MNYSFIRPGKKTILKKVSRIWWGYIFLTIFIFVGFVGVLHVQGYFMRIKAQDAIAKQELVQEEIKNYQRLEIQEKQKVDFALHLANQNMLLEESVKNLFGLIPEQITLNKIEMLESELTLYGITPSKQIYTFLLEVPLRSIFNQSRANFYMLPNGWYNFVSVSKLDKTKEIQKEDEKDVKKDEVEK